MPLLREMPTACTDLMIAPARELGCVIRMIRDGQFKPDNPRSDYFPGEMFAAATIPGPSFQPKTLAFFSKPSEDVGEKALAPQPEISDEIKEEAPLADVKEDGVIEIPSDEEATVEVSDEETSLVDLNLPSAHAFIRHVKSRIVHCVLNAGSEVTDSTYANSELLQGKVTACGRSTSRSYEVIKVSDEMSAKCRVCFKIEWTGCMASALDLSDVQ